MKDIDRDTYKIINEATQNYERELIKKIREDKDKEAFFKLIKMYDARIYSLIYRFLGSKEDAIELTQDVFIQVYKKIHQYKGESAFVFWLQKIAVNFCLNKIRINKKDLLKKAESLNSRSDFLQDKYTKDPLTSLEEQEKNSFVRQCLLKVTPLYRIVLMLRDIEGASYDEIAKLLKCSLGTVKSRISRGREEFKRILFRLKNEVNKYEM